MVNRRQLLQGIGFGAAGMLLPAKMFARSLPLQVKTTGGVVQGYASNPGGSTIHSVAAFKGVPYGADTRQTRFQAPKPAPSWDGVKACTEWAPRAPQQTPDHPKPDPTNAGFNAIMGAPIHYHLPEDEGAQSEDCLHLNIWTSAVNNSSARLPVLFYIHGGAYNNGTVNAPIYDGTRLAQRGDVVVVTVNHRLNAFGYMYLAGLPGLADTYRDSGNAGMLDLVLALEWVRDNIASFGGDPSRVTIFGQSGGGAKCATLMAMESAHGLFHRVWTMSGQQVWAPSKKISSERAVTALAAMGLSGAISPAALNALTTTQIQAGARTTPNWLPVLDDVVLKRNPFQPDAPPISNAIPMVLGNTKDEIMGATAWRLANLTWDTLPAELGKAIAAFQGTYTVAEIIKAYRTWYPAHSPVDVYVASIAAFRSWPGQVIEAERRASNDEAAKHTWVYQFDFPSPTADGRAPHTIDIAFVFDNLRLSPGVAGDSAADLKAAQPLATLISNMLVHFATTGDPNLPHAPQWPVYDLKDRETMIFDKQSHAVSDPRGNERRMMAGAHYRQPGTE